MEAGRREEGWRAAVAEGPSLEAGTNSMLRIKAEGSAQFNTEFGILDWAQIGTDADYGTSNFEGLGSLKPSQFSAIISRVSADGTRLEPVP